MPRLRAALGTVGIGCAGRPAKSRWCESITMKEQRSTSAPSHARGGREAAREALTGECAGQPLSHEKADIPGADAVRYAEGHTKGRAIASSPTTRRGRRPWHVQTLFVREPGGLVVDQGGMPRIGPHREGEEPKPMMHGREKSDPALVARKPANNAGQPAQERVERGAGTDGNAGHQSTSVPQDQ